MHRGPARKIHLRRSSLASLALAFSGAAPASAAEIKVVTVGALQNAFKPLGAEFTKQSGDQVNYIFTNPANLEKALADGKFDLIIAATPSVEELDKAGGCRPAATSRRSASASAWR